jgi:hypothetical protein
MYAPFDQKIRLELACRTFKDAAGALSSDVTEYERDGVRLAAVEIIDCAATNEAQVLREEGNETKKQQRRQ